MVGLRDRGHLDGRQVADGAFVAREPDPARRQLHHVSEDLGDLNVVERLLLEQLAGEPIEHGAVEHERLVGFVVRLLDDGAHLGINRDGDTLGVIT